MAWWETVDWQDPINRSCSLNSGLVGWWMGTPLCFGGTRIVDLLNRNNGTLTNMDPATGWVGTSYGLGLDFDGSNDYVDQVSSNCPDGSTLTISVMFRSVASVSVLVDARSASYVDGKYGIYLLNAKPTIYSSFTNRSANTALSVNTLYRIRQSFSSSGLLRWYLNGVPDGSVSIGRNTATVDNMRVGARAAGSFPSNCVVLDYQLHDIATGDAEAAADYDQWRRGFPDTLHWLRGRSMVSVPASPVVGSRLLNLRRRAAAA